MENFGGRRIRSNIGSQYVPTQTVHRQDRVLDKVLADHQRNYSREEEKVRRQLHKLQIEKTKHVASKRDLTQTAGAESCLVLHDRDHAPGEHLRSTHRIHLDASHGKEAYRLKSQQLLKEVKQHATLEPIELENKKSVSFKKGQGKSNMQRTLSGDKAKVPSKKMGTESKLPVIEIEIPVVKIGVVDIDSSSSVNKSQDSLNSACSLTKALKLCPTASIRSFYDMALKKYSQSNFSSDEDIKLKGQSSQDSQRAGMSCDKLPELDRNAFKELEGIIKEAKTKTMRKEAGNSYGSRQQRRRLQHLEHLLEEMRPRVKQTDPFDPLSILECQYLRLSKDNIEQLEKMVRESGRDPGIHAHSNVTDFNIWQ